jgi:hypothetical protein
MNLPIYKLVVDEEELGLEAVALVDNPAIQVNWQAFNNSKPIKFQQVGDRQIVSGPLMIPDLPIYRRDNEKGEHYVIFDRDTIEQCALKYFKNGLHNSVNIMHDSDEVVNGATMIETFFIDKSRGVETPKGYDELPDGTWWGTYKITDKNLWENFIKTGEFKGFSVEGLFKYEYEKQEDAKLIEEITKALINGNN